jgi:hypothetical protein
VDAVDLAGRSNGYKDKLSPNAITRLKRFSKDRSSKTHCPGVRTLDSALTRLRFNAKGDGGRDEFSENQAMDKDVCPLVVAPVNHAAPVRMLGQMASIVRWQALDPQRQS